MKRLLTIAAVLAGACGLLSPATMAAESGDTGRQPLERIVAVVNESVILASELEEKTRLFRMRMERAGESPPPAKRLRERMLDQLILEEIQHQQARRRGIEIGEEEINSALRNIASERGTDLPGLRERMSREDGLSFEQLREEARTQLLLARLRQRVIASQVTITEQEIDDFLQRSERASDRDVAYHLRHLLLRVSEDATEQEVEETAERAGRLVHDLRDGADFGALAARVSDGPEASSGGDLGWRDPAGLPGLFIEALQSMAPGDVSEPLRSANGFHVLKLVERRGGEPQSITEHRARHILLRDEGEGDRQRRQLEELRRRILDGASFEQLARRHSVDQGTAADGGDLGWFGPGEMAPAFQEVVETLEPGQISEPFRTPNGWHIVELLDQRERTDVEQRRRAQARQTLYRQRVEDETRRWLRERREEAYIDRRLDGE